MTRYEYKVLPAPAKGVKAKGARTTEARFANALMVLMNEQGRDGWEYQRTDTLPCEERVGLTGRTTKFQNMLVFRRALPEAKDAAPQIMPELDDFEQDTDAPEADDAPQPVFARSSVAKRLAATLSSRPHEGVSPSLRAVGEAGPAPKLGAAAGNGMSRTGTATGTAAE